MRIKLFLAFIVVLVSNNTILAQTAAFTYQGKLVENGNPANANYDFEFKLYDALSSGNLLGARTRLNVAVTNGVFTVTLDFPTASFDGNDRYLEIGVRTAGSLGGYQQLLPRQPLTSAPYALRSLNATNADAATSAINATNATTAQNALQLGGVNANQFILTTDARLSDARNPLPNSSNYIQNTDIVQSADFNIDGDGTAYLFNARAEFQINGQHTLSVRGNQNIFAGVGTGAANTTGANNSFFGTQAGAANTTGVGSSFFGYRAGFVNTAGGNSFFGNFAGASNTTAVNNAFFGAEAGFGNSSGTRNSFFGLSAGRNNQTGNDNAFFGYRAGLNNTASFNSFFGSSAGDSTTSGEKNAFFGYNAGNTNSTGRDNAFFGYNTGQLNSSGVANAFFGTGAGPVNSIGNYNTFVGTAAGFNNTTGSSNVFFGTGTGQTNTTGNYNTAIGTTADVGAGNLDHATAIGAGAVVNASNTVVLGRSGDNVIVPGNLFVQALGTGGSTTICTTASGKISTCSSSLRYKTAVQSFEGGLDIVRRLRPITFNWQDGGLKDVGFAAEEVGKIEPLLITRNAKGEVEGVKYGQLTTVLVNAVNEQQEQVQKQRAQLEQQQKQTKQLQEQLKQQQQQIDVLKRLVCLQNLQAEVCQ